MDTEGNIIVSPQFDKMYPFKDGDLTKVETKGKWGFINKEGRIVIEPQFDEASLFENDMAAVEKNNKWGYINPQGEILIPIKYDSVSPLHENTLDMNTFD